MFSAAVIVLLAAVLLVALLILNRTGSRDGTDARLREELARAEQRRTEDARALREELASSIQRFVLQTEQRSESLRASVVQQLSVSRDESSGLLRGFLTATTDLQRDQQAQLEAIRGVVDQRLLALQTDNAARLETMRQTVDEKLQSTLEARLGESFRLVSERLEQVHKGLGEMQNLAAGVGDLKRVLGNVTTRGAWGEVQLENLLAQMLAPEQYERNIAVTGTAERVEFAIRLPGGEGKDGDPVWLPVDAKFPSEAYQRLAAAAERGDADGVDAAARELEAAIRASARTFSSKYLAPPRTTDFGILFLATEGLYAEALRRPGLAETLQRDYRVVLAGPTTFAALLNSLQMGFKTLAIQQRSSEVWKLLGDVKLQFGKYSEVLANIRKRLDQATQTVDDAAIRTRAIEKRLRSVETPEEAPAAAQLRLVAGSDGN